MKRKKVDEIQWESTESNIVEDSKFKKKLTKVFQIVIKWSGIIETIILILLSIKVKDTGNKYWILLLLVSLFLGYKNIRKYIKVWKSKAILINEEQNKRVVGQEGNQGSGKTSLMLYIASIMKRPVFTSAPAKINGKYTYKLTSDMLNMNVKLPYKPLLIVDEISLYFDNRYSKFFNESTEGFEYHLQLIRHNHDGYFLDASVDMNRVAKRIEEKHGMYRRLLGQQNSNNSFFLAPFLVLIAKLLKLDIKSGYRIWTYQTFETINHEGYIFDLSTLEKNTKNNHYSNLNEIWAFNDNINFEYDDRYFKKLYLKLPKAKLEKWNQLNFNYESLVETGFSDIVNFYKKKYREIGIEKDDHEVGGNDA